MSDKIEGGRLYSVDVGPGAADYVIASSLSDAVRKWCLHFISQHPCKGEPSGLRVNVVSEKAVIQ